MGIPLVRDCQKQAVAKYMDSDQVVGSRQRVAVKRGMKVILDFVFNTVPGDSLFDLMRPPGYRIAPASAEPLAARTRMTCAMRKPVVPLRKYAAEQKNNSPEDLSELEPDGVTVRNLVRSSSCSM